MFGFAKSEAWKKKGCKPMSYRTRVTSGASGFNNSPAIAS